MSTYSNQLQPALQNLLQCVVRFFHQRLSCTTMHISADVQRITLNASCMTISGERTEQLDIFCSITGFTGDFLGFIDVKLIRFCHGALQLNGSVKEPNMFHLHNYETEKITRKASDLAENQVQFFRPRSSCTTHLLLFSERLPIYAWCMTISGERAEQHVIIAGFLPCDWLYKWFSSAENVRRYMRRAWWSRVEPNTL